MSIRDELGPRLLFVDGAMGTMLHKAGLKAGELPEGWNIEHPEELRRIHGAYLDAGSDIITANTFGVNALKLKDTPYGVQQLVSSAVNLAREAIAKSGKKAYVALDVGPLGRLLKPLGDLEFETAVELFGEVCRAGEEAGADLVFIETMSDTLELKAAVLAAKEQTGLPVFATVTFQSNGKLLTGGDAAAVVALLEGLRADALGVNCSLGPKQLVDLVDALREFASIPLIVQPNAGLPDTRNGETVYDVGPEEFAQWMERIAEHGACVLGGCCGTTPEHILAMVNRLKTRAPEPIEKKELTVISSYDHAVMIGDDPVIVGERINPNGNPRFREAMREGDMDYIMREALKQQQGGASSLDINTGLPDIDEVATLEKVIRSVQSVCNAPIQIDTSNVAALERAVRSYNGKPMINSVNGKPESTHSVFPIVQKYGGAVIALTLDQNGIPDTAEGRFAIAERILEVAKTYGLGKKDLVFDTLAMAISTGKKSALIALETMRMIRERLGARTILGVSNISFGLPAREHINAAFLTMAIHAGLSAAIINPNSDEMLAAFYASRALCGADEKCMGYIAKYSDQQPKSAQPDEAMGLYQAVVHGMKERAAKAAAKELLSRAPLEIIDEMLVPALNEVGAGFEQSKLYLPQLLMSGEAAQTAFDVIRAHMAKSGQVQKKKGRIVVATVKGDIHDIGKNIVKALLLNYSYDVLDLGKDVSPEVIVNAVKDNDIKLVGLSALMTTTVVGMEKTIELLREQAPECRIMVGGAVLTERYATKIGADCYSADAMGSVRYAEQVFGS
ncbi:MAG: homocysteine S-methyltransferase family protein [Bacillota bacterium]